MKKAVNAWTFPSDMPVKERIQEAAKAGYDGIELIFTEQGEVSLERTDAELAEYRKLAESLGIEIPSIVASVYGRDNLANPDPAIIDAGIERGARALHAAAVLGADTILLVPGRVNKETENPNGRYDIVYENAAKNVKRLAKFAEQEGVYIGIENVWNKFLLSPLEMRTFVDSAESPYVGVYFDVGNFLPWAFPEQWIRILGSRIKKMHVKDYLISSGPCGTFVDLLEGSVDYAEVMHACREVGYDNYMVAEVPPFAADRTLKAKTTALAMDTIFNLK